jgi:hypothetical protein
VTDLYPPLATQETPGRRTTNVSHLGLVEEDGEDVRSGLVAKASWDSVQTSPHEVHYPKSDNVVVLFIESATIWFETGDDSSRAAPCNIYQYFSCASGVGLKLAARYATVSIVPECLRSSQGYRGILWMLHRICVCGPGCVDGARCGKCG